MARNNHTGKRLKRDQRKKYPPELGYYLIFTDAEATEKLYFEGLRNSLPKDIQRKLVIKVETKKTKKLIEECLKQMTYNPQYLSPWIVFDRDRVPNFNQIIEEAKNKGIHVGWSNPCFEIWLYCYFEDMPAIKESDKCWKKFADTFLKNTKRDYRKSDKKIYQTLTKYGDEQKAIDLAKQKYNECIKNKKKNPSDMIPCTTVHQLVEEIKQKSNA